MKKLGFVTMALLLLCMTQCKKKTANTVVDESVLVPMTLTVNSAKTDINAGKITWETDDVVYVAIASDGIIGKLTCDASDVVTFNGSVDMSGKSYGEYTFNFYYLGNNTSIANGTKTFDMSMSGQTGARGGLGDFHIASGNQVVTYSGSSISANATMNTYTSVAFVDLTGFNRYSETGENLYMYGDNIYESVRINLENNTFTPQNGNQYIKVGSSADNHTAYYMILPTTEGKLVNLVNKRTSASMRFDAGISSNCWYCNGGVSTDPIAVSGAYYAKGALRGEFTANPDKGTIVHFSQGNLQYLGTGNDDLQTPRWRVADNQYDYMGSGVQGNVKYSGYSQYNTPAGESGETKNDPQPARDMFGWGATGYNNVYPYLSIQNNSCYAYGTTSDASIAGTNYDWGIYLRESIENIASDEAWYTLSKAEWTNIMGREMSVSGSPQKMYGYATVKGVKGLIVLPDNWDGIIDDGFVPETQSYGSNNYTADKWDEMEAAGCVFLPADGYRRGSFQHVQATGYYWSTTGTSGGSTYTLMFYEGTFNTANSNSRQRGICVRLVL